MILWSKNQQFRLVIEDLVKLYTKSDYPESSITSNLFWTEAKSSNLVLISVSAETNKKIIFLILHFLLKQKQESFFLFQYRFWLKQRNDFGFSYPTDFSQIVSLRENLKAHFIFKFYSCANFKIHFSANQAVYHNS